MKINMFAAISGRKIIIIAIGLTLLAVGCKKKTETPKNPPPKPATTNIQDVPNATSTQDLPDVEVEE